MEANRSHDDVTEVRARRTYKVRASSVIQIIVIAVVTQIMIANSTLLDVAALLGDSKATLAVKQRASPSWSEANTSSSIIGKPLPSETGNLLTAAPEGVPARPKGVPAVPYQYMIEHAKELRAEAARIRQSGEVSTSSSRVHFFTYATDNLADVRERLRIEAECTGWFASVREFGPTDLPEQFRHEFNDILKMGRGGGYWLWRYPVYEIMLKMIPIGDYMLFADAGCLINPKGSNRLMEYVQMLQASPEFDFLNFQSPHLEDKFTTDRIFEAFSVGANNTQIRKSGQIIATVTMIRNGPNAREMLAKAYNILHHDPYIITDQYNAETKSRRPGTFQDNRHDQSVSSVLVKLMGSVTIPDETWPVDFSSTRPILAGRHKHVARKQMEQMRTWKANNCSGTNPYHSK